MEDILSTMGDVQYPGGYHYTCGRISLYMWEDIISTVGVFSTPTFFMFSIEWDIMLIVWGMLTTSTFFVKSPMVLKIPSTVLNIPHVTLYG